MISPSEAKDLNMFRNALMIVAPLALAFTFTADADAQNSSTRITRSSNIRPTGNIRPITDVRPTANRSRNVRTTTFIPNYGYPYVYGRYTVPNFPRVSGTPTSRISPPNRQPFNPSTANILVYPIRTRTGGIRSTSGSFSTSRRSAR